MYFLQISPDLGIEYYCVQFTLYVVTVFAQLITSAIRIALNSNNYEQYITMQ